MQGNFRGSMGFFHGFSGDLRDITPVRENQMENKIMKLKPGLYRGLWFF